MAGRLVLVGRAAGAFGVRGELRITSYTAQPLALLDYRRLLREDGSPALVLTGARTSRANELVARAEGISDKDAADALQGVKLYVARDALPAPDVDEFYLADLIGLEARTATGEPLGRVKAVHDHGAGDILEIEPASGPSRLVAFTRETVPEVRIEGGYVVVSLPHDIADDEQA